MTVLDDQPVVEITDGDVPHVAIVTFRRGEYNYFNLELLTKLADAFDALASTDTRAVILRSGGRHFCAGASFGPSNFAEPEGEHIHESAVPRLFAQPIPVIAIVDGAAIGGGLGLALTADFRVGTPRAKFAANFSRIGVSHGFGISASLPRVVGEQRAAELLLTGRRFDGTEALELGLCDRLVEPDRAEAEAQTLAAEIATASPLAGRVIRRTLRAPLLASLKEALIEEREDQRSLRETSDFREGVTAYGQRRAAQFTGE